MPDLAHGRTWDPALAGDLPDCRLSYANREKKIVMRGRVPMEVVFCANCHEEKGLVTAEWTAHVFFLCDDCFYKMNGISPPGTVQVPDRAVQS